MRYEVQTLFIDQWENCWKDEDGNNITFASEAQAQADIDDHIEICEEAFQKGYIQDVPSRDELRIMPVEIIQKGEGK